MSKETPSMAVSVAISLEQNFVHALKENPSNSSKRLTECIILAKRGSHLYGAGHLRAASRVRILETRAAAISGGACNFSIPFERRNFPQKL